MAHENESLFLAFRRFFPIAKQPTSSVEDEDQIVDFFKDRFAAIAGRVGILLSSGVDSAILARFLPAGSIAYTIDYAANYAAHSEFSGASQFVPSGVEHKRIIIERSAYFSAIDDLTVGRKAPTVPHEAAVFIAAMQAMRDGIEFLVAGFGADGRFGGFPELYRDDRPEAFRKQLFSSYIDPSRALVDPAPVDWVFERYTENGRIAVQRFLNEVGTEGNSAREAIELAGIVPVTPYTELSYAKPFDLTQESKYLLSNVFRIVYGYRPPARKIALWVPYNDWFGGIRIRRPEFQPGCTIVKPMFSGEPAGIVPRILRRARHEVNRVRGARKQFSAKQGYLLVSLERYFHFKEQHRWVTPNPHGQEAATSPMQHSAS